VHYFDNKVLDLMACLKIRSDIKDDKRQTMKYLTNDELERIRKDAVLRH
jgi:hypothetical protein